MVCATLDFMAPCRYSLSGIYRFSGEKDSPNAEATQQLLS